jgi:translation initiation factor 5B
LDKIRNTSVQAREAEGITQHIGASFFPVETLKQLIGSLLSMIKGKIEIPGLLVIDTPGHEAFTNLRKRGGGVADIAILVIDILRGFETQTYECLEILKARKTPFLVAANKIDRIPGWKSYSGTSFLETYSKQDRYVKDDLDNRIYRILGEFSRLEFKTDRFDRVKDFTKTVAVIPTSAKTGEGITELLVVLVGLAQQYLREQLQITEDAAKGTVLEVKEEPGLGLTINTIIYDGILRKDDLIVIGGKEDPIITQIRAILVPKALDEIRDPRDRFSSVDSISAAAGVKIVAPDLEGALAGAPLYAVSNNEEVGKYVQLVSHEIERIRITTDIDGVVLKADTLGSLEAIAESLKQKGVPIRLADVGDVSKRDIVEANVVRGHEPLYGVVLAFNVKILSDAAEEAAVTNIQIFHEGIIYRLVDDYLLWLKTQRGKKNEEEFEKLVMPGQVRILPDFIFRRAKPAIFGVEVLTGRIRSKYKLVRAEDMKEVGEIQQIQDKGDTLSEAKQGMQVAISMDKPVVGRHIFENDVLLVKVPEEHAKMLLTKFIDDLSLEDQEALEKYVKMMRNKVPFWAASEKSDAGGFL